MQKKALVIPSRGIGDGLLMMIVSNHLQKAGYETTICHPLLHELKSWFPNFHFSIKEDFFLFDRIIVQNDNSKFMDELKNLRKNHRLKKVSFFYGGYNKKKHGPLEPWDFVFDLSLSMVENIAAGSSRLLSTPYSKECGIIVPSFLKKSVHPKRAVIHPITKKEKSYPIKRFISIAGHLREKGHEISFAMSPSEREKHLFLQDLGFGLPFLSNLSDLAAFIYESGHFIGLDSGPGHLASLLDIPSVIIGFDKKQMKLWQPGWRKASLVFPPKYLLNIKYLRLKQKFWKSFISPKKVIKTFQKIS